MSSYDYKYLALFPYFCEIADFLVIRNTVRLSENGLRSLKDNQDLHDKRHCIMRTRDCTACIECREQVTLSVTSRGKGWTVEARTFERTHFHPRTSNSLVRCVRIKQ